MASARFLEDLNAFRGLPKESLLRLADRFDEVADPLLRANLMTPRGLALNLRIHVLAHIRRSTLGQMLREDQRRSVNNKPLVDKDELLTMMRNAEAFLLEFETEQRAAGLTPSPRDTDISFPAPVFPPKTVPKNMEERLGGGGRDIKERLGPRQEHTEDLRACNACKKVGHIARNCPTMGRSPLPPPPLPAAIARASTSGGGSLASHVTKGAICTSCQKPGHVAAQC